MLLLSGLRALTQPGDKDMKESFRINIKINIHNIKIITITTNQLMKPMG